MSGSEYGFSIDVHCAGAALAMIAPLLRADQTKMLAQRIEQRRPDIDGRLIAVVVDLQGERYPRIDDSGIHVCLLPQCHLS